MSESINGSLSAESGEGQFEDGLAYGVVVESPDGNGPARKLEIWQQEDGTFTYKVTNMEDRTKETVHKFVTAQEAAEAMRNYLDDKGYDMPGPKDPSWKKTPKGQSGDGGVDVQRR